MPFTTSTSPRAQVHAPVTRDVPVHPARVTAGGDVDDRAGVAAKVEHPGTGAVRGPGGPGARQQCGGYDTQRR